MRRLNPLERSHRDFSSSNVCILLDSNERANLAEFYQHLQTGLAVGIGRFATGGLGGITAAATYFVTSLPPERLR